MNEKKSLIDKFSFISKLKKIKGIEYIIIGIVCVLVLVIYFATNTNHTGTSYQTSGQEQKTNSTSYAQEIENKLCNVLSQVKNAGKVSAMITLESGGEIVVATSTEERENTTQGTNNSTKSNTKVESPVIVNNAPLIVMEYFPKIKGVVIVAQGAKDVKVRLELLRAVQTLIDVDASRIEILAGN